MTADGERQAKLTGADEARLNVYLTAVNPTCTRRMPTVRYILLHSSVREAYISIIQTEGETEMTTLRQKISQFAAYQRTVRELTQLSNVQLRDLGITRDDIKAVAKTAAN